MPNSLAYLVLYASPVVVAVLFGVLPRTYALIWSVLGGFMLLPVGIGADLQLLPPFTKDVLPVAAAGVMCLLVGRDRSDEAGGAERFRAAARQAAPDRTSSPGPSRRSEAALSLAYQRGQAPVRLRLETSRVAGRSGPTPARRRLVGRALLLLLLTTPLLTVMQNTEPVVAGPTVIAGLQIYDAFSMILNVSVSVLPLLLARRYLATPAHHVSLLRALCVAGIIYSLPALFEVRMSPQLNTWIYGYFPHSFLQQMRGGGFRPVIFLGHGLVVAIFFAMTIVASVALWRHGRASSNGWGGLAAGCWLLIVLVFCKSLGALIATLLIMPVALFMPLRLQMTVAAVVAAVSLSYPILRGSGLIPVEQAVEMAASISEDRAASLQYRLDNEDVLLEKANLKWLQGWGSWGRNRVYDPESGKDLSVTDGAWIIIVGTYGWLGYIAHFGLLGVPMMLLAWRRGATISPATAGLCLVLAVNLMDLIPNASLTVLTWLIAGAILGNWEGGGAQVAETDSAIPGRRQMASRQPRMASIRNRADAPDPAP